MTLEMPPFKDLELVYEILRRNIHTVRLYWRGAAVHGVERSAFNTLVESAMFLGGTPTFEITLLNTSFYDPKQIDRNLVDACIPDCSWPRPPEPLSRSPGLWEQVWVDHLARRTGAEVVDFRVEPPPKPKARFRMMSVRTESGVALSPRWIEPYNASWTLRISAPDALFVNRTFRYGLPLEELLDLGSLCRLRESYALRLGGEYQQQRMLYVLARWLEDSLGSLEEMVAMLALRASLHPVRG